LPDVVVRAADEYNEDPGHEPKINVVGMCCTGMEVLMRRGINFGGDILQQELAIATGAIELVVADIQCTQPAIVDAVELFRELIRNNILVVLTGCVATIASYWDLLKPDPTYPGVGESLAAVMDVIAKANKLEAVPPCLFMGACVDNSRIEEVLNAVADYIGVRIDQLPIAGSAPEYIAEKAIPIGFWTVSLGIFTHIGDQPNVAASERVVKWLTDDVEQIFGGKFYVEADPYKSAEKIIEVIEDKRKALGI
jgi:carbon-monoxide dehydrogenase catalytic subunit